MNRRPKVTIIYRSLPLYRIPFFEAIHPILRQEGIDLQLIYGQAGPEEKEKRDTGDIDWAYKIHNHVFRMGSRSLYYQPCLHHLRGSDLIIVEQASRLLINYLLLLKQQMGGPKLALWGHGRTIREKKANPLGEFAKNFVTRHVHWWFAYNDRSADIVKNIGFSPDQITIVQNTIETASLVRKKCTITEKEVDYLRCKLALDSRNVALYVGGLYKEKRIDYLIEAAARIRKIIPDFHLIVLGAGPEEMLIKRASNLHSWIHYVGPRFNTDRVPYFMLAKVLLLPASVGLAVIDSFALEVPLITTDQATNGPEIDYLLNGINGLKLDSDTHPDTYARTVATLFNDTDRWLKLKEGCRESAKLYTLDEMVRRFGEGVRRALSLA